MGEKSYNVEDADQNSKLRIFLPPSSGGKKWFLEGVKFFYQGAFSSWNAARVLLGSPLSKLDFCLFYLSWLMFDLEVNIQLLPASTLSFWVQH